MKQKPRELKNYLTNIRISDILITGDKLMGLGATKVGKRGTVVIPANLRRKYGLEEGSLVIAEARPEGVLLRPVVTLPIEIYTPERKAEFLLNNAITPKDYAWAVKEVQKMGLDPETIPHEKPKDI